ELAADLPRAADAAAGALLRRRDLGARHEAHLRGELVDGQDQQAMRGVERGAAPRHAADVAGEDQRAAQARRREHALVAQLGDLVATPGAIAVAASDRRRVERLP